MDRLQVIARLERWGPVDVTDMLANWRFGTRIGVGFDVADITVEGPESGLWVLQDHGAEDSLEFWGNGELAWVGLLAGGGLQGAGSTLSVLQLTAEGKGLRLRDLEVWRVFADPDYGRWLADDNLQEGWSADNNNRVFVGASGTFITGDESAVRYPDAETELGGAIVKVEALAALAITSGSWVAEVRDNAGNVLWTASVGTEKSYTLFLDGATGGTFKLGDGDAIETAALNYNDAAAAIESALQTAYSDATITVVDDTDFTITFPTGGPDVQITDNSLTYAATGTPTCTLISDTEVIDEAVADAEGLVVALRATADGAGEATLRLTQITVRLVDPCTSSDIVEALLTAYGGMETDISASGVQVDRAAWQGESYLEAISDMAALGDGAEAWLFQVYDDTASLGPWPETALWRLEREDLTQWRVEWRRDAVINAVRAELPDGWRSDWLTDTDSIARWGRRELTLRLPMTTRTEAEKLAAVYLDERAWPLASLQIDAGSRCRKVDRSIAWPVWLIHAGDSVVLHDLLPDEDRVIQVAETEMSASGMRITPRGVNTRLDVILAGMERKR